ncbi:MAG: FmdE family protein [Desulfobacteraceae bacterium]|jgi:formylmethanofuran dehydrogenase subunit E|nr:FmdE family protein [Desulfobacteraceae bacterium]
MKTTAREMPMPDAAAPDPQEANSRPGDATLSIDPLWCRDYRGNEYTYPEALDFIRSFHGHVAPGLVIGLKMVDWAREKLPEGILFDGICETSSCLPDAVQMLTPCTVGNNWLKIKDLGRFALTLYDKFNGDGVRVFLDPAKLQRWPEFFDWFYKRKPKPEQDFDRLLEEIRQVGADCLSRTPATIHPTYRVKNSKGRIDTCPLCGEAYPVIHGGICRGCQGGAPYAQSRLVEPREVTQGPTLKVVPVVEAAGKRALHDMTRVVPAQTKGPAFRQGQRISTGDICRLQQMGRHHVYVGDAAREIPGWVHENQAALAFAESMAGPGVRYSTPPREGKVTLSADRNGLLVIDHQRLSAFNTVEGVMCASRKCFDVVETQSALAATRAIPLYLPESDFHTAMAVLSTGPLLRVAPLASVNVGILVTGTEVFQGLIQDSFIPIIRSKVASYDCAVVKTAIVPDDRPAIRDGVAKMIAAGAGLIVTTAGLSVDPDDVTRQGLLDAGCTDLVYGAPILPGAMTLVGRVGEITVIGVPACGLYHKTTSFDLLLPRILAGLTIGRRELAEMGHGGFCRDCPVCTYPQCTFGR